MRALVCEAPGSLVLADRPDPTPREGEFIVRIRRAGVCGTDFHIFGGKHPYLAYPRVMGHELAGEVVHAPPGSPIGHGARVTIIPYLSCNNCRACRRGVTNACRRLSVLGVHQDGGMADYIAVPAANIIETGDLDLDEAAMVEFLAIGAHGVARGAITADDRVLVIGAGPIGMSALLFASLRGADVTALDRRADRLRVARESLGATDTVVPSDQLEAELASLTGGDFFDVVIDATGSAGSIARGLDFVGHGGRYVLLSVVREDLVFPDPEFHKRETTLLASRNARPADFDDVLTALRAGQVPTRALRTHHATLADAPGAFGEWLRPEVGVIKAMLHL